MRNKATKKNMDLDLRRYGKMLYTKAEESGGSGGSDSGRVSIVDLLKEAVRERDEFDGSNYDSNMHYPDTFVYNDVSGYLEYPPSAGEVVGSPGDFFSQTPVGIPAYADCPVFDKDVLYMLSFKQPFPMPLREDSHRIVSITTGGDPSHGVPSKTLYIIEKVASPK